jgi:hypothetical protein
VSRPATLKQAVVMALAGSKSFGDAVDEFVDAFYLDHGRGERQQAMIDEAPPLTGEPAKDAWIGAVGEHLAGRWGLKIPAWSRRPGHYRLGLPKFIPETVALRPTLLSESPAAFRSRMIFTFAEPLQRARFPRKPR